MLYIVVHKLSLLSGTVASFNLQFVTLLQFLAVRYPFLLVLVLGLVGLKFFSVYTSVVSPCPYYICIYAGCLQSIDSMQEDHTIMATSTPLFDVLQSWDTV